MDPQIRDNLKHLSSSVWITSFGVISLGSFIYLKILWFKFPLWITTIHYPFINSRTLVCFHLLVIMNIVRMSKAEPVSAELGVECFEICQVVKLDHMVGLLLNFWEFSTLIEIVTVSVFHPINSKWVAPFTYILHNLCYQLFSWSWPIF